MITPVLYNNECNYQQLQRNCSVKPVYNTFNKSGIIAFKGGCSDIFVRSSKSNNDDFDEISNSVNKKHFIGGGSEGDVYQMKEPNLVVKVPNSLLDNYKLRTDKALENFEEMPVTEQDRVNFITKKYKNGIKIMDKVKGSPIRTKEEYAEVAELPISSYKKILDQITDAHNKGMVFDYAMNNILYDKDSKSLTAIDFRKNDSKEGFTPLQGLYYGLNCCDSPHEKKIAGKIMIAALNSMKPKYDTKIPYQGYDFKTITWFLQNHYPEDCVKIINIENEIDKVKIVKSYAEQPYDKEFLDYSINKTAHMIKDYYTVE